jgi:hypothetical protein
MNKKLKKEECQQTASARNVQKPEYFGEVYGIGEETS